jgi:parallel beta-helix repeat protein
VPFADGTSVMPQWIVIENLEIRAPTTRTRSPLPAAPPRPTPPASAIYVEFGENITVRNCDMNNNGNGFFVFSSDTIASRNILVEGNSIHDNGNVGSIYEHNVYVEAIGITFQYNHLGQLLPGAGGNNLKDRSAGSSSATTGSSTPTGSSTSCTPRTARSCAPTRATGRRMSTAT